MSRYPPDAGESPSGHNGVVLVVTVVLSAFLVVSALTALRPSRRGFFAILAWPVGWAAGELPAHAIGWQALILVVQWWWSWPTELGRDVLLTVATMSVSANLALIGVQLRAPAVVRRQLEKSPRAPLRVPTHREDRFGNWWRTALQWSFHPRTLHLRHNVAYGPAPRHRLDVWRLPTTPAGAPVMLYVHGGSWIFGDKSEMGRPMLHEMVSRGWVAVSINYRLAPSHPWPSQIEDAFLALAWIKRHIAVHGGDPDRIVVAGGSAGGHLAALLALTADTSPWRPPVAVTDWSVRGCVTFYGVLEMTGDETYWRGLGQGLRHLLENQVVQVPVDGNEDMYRGMSPLHQISVNAPPFLVVQGAADTLVDRDVARGFVERFRAVSPAPCYYVELPLTQHTFDLTASPRTSATTRAVVAFAEAVAAPRPSLTPALLDAYQSPPTEVVVDVEGDDVSPVELARREGPFVILTADNPYSRVLSDDENNRRRSELHDLLHRHALIHRPTLARDPAGLFPSEKGFAIWGLAEDSVAAWARAFDQHAVYEVNPDGLVVRAAR